MFIDTHIDTLWAMRKQKRSFSSRSESGHVDLPRAQEADLLCGFFTGFPTESQYATERMLREWLGMVNTPENKLWRIESYTDLEVLIDQRKRTEAVSDREIGIVLHFEGAAGIDSELNRLYIYYDCGLRSMSLTWNEENQFATGQLQGEHRGLTKEGRDLLSAMEDLGIIIDVSHLNDKSFWDVISNTNSPIIASHSNVRELADHRRNLTREMLQAIHDSGGTVGVNLCTAFLSKDPEKATREHAIAMFEEIISVADVSTVHSGTDLDGAPFPPGLDDITAIPSLLEDVAERLSLDEHDLRKIQRENVMRVMRHYWKD